MLPTHSEIFVAALKACLSGTPRGTQAAVARKANISPAVLNDILKGRTSGSEETKRAIAAALGYPARNYENFLDIGRRLFMENNAEQIMAAAEGSRSHILALPALPSYSKPGASQSEPLLAASPAFAGDDGTKPEPQPVALRALSLGAPEKEWNAINQFAIPVTSPNFKPHWIVVQAVDKSLYHVGVMPGMQLYCDPTLEPVPGDIIFIETKERGNPLGGLRVYDGRDSVPADPHILISSVRIQGDAPLLFTTSLALDSISTLATVVLVRRRI